MKLDEKVKTKSREAFVLRIVPGEYDTTLELAGELDMASANLLRTEIDAALESGTQRVVLDLSELTFIDSSGIRVLYRAWERSHEGPDTLTIRRARGLVERVLSLAGLATVILEDA